ncbi:MAG: hypothetical protein WD178_07315 [Actinomycetota bacterium]
MTRGRLRFVALTLLTLVAAWAVARVDKGHAWLGLTLILMLLTLAIWGVGLRIIGRVQTPISYMVLHHWTENVLILQALGGVALLIMGSRMSSGLFPWDHYIYGSLFPLLALISGRVAGLRREREYVGMAWGAFFAAALSLQALATGCELVIDASCLAR